MRKTKLGAIALGALLTLGALTGCSATEAKDNIKGLFQKPFAELKVSADAKKFTKESTEAHDVFTFGNDLIEFKVIQDSGLDYIDYKQYKLRDAETSPYYVTFTAEAVEKVAEGYTYRVMVNGVRAGVWTPGEFETEGIAFIDIKGDKAPTIKVYKDAKIPATSAVASAEASA